MMLPLVLSSVASACPPLQTLGALLSHRVSPIVVAPF